MKKLMLLVAILAMAATANAVVFEDFEGYTDTADLNANGSLYLPPNMSYGLSSAALVEMSMARLLSSQEADIRPIPILVGIGVMQLPVTLT